MNSRLIISVIIVICISFAGATAAQCKTVYVSVDGSDSNNGSTWVLAKKTVQAGINAAVSGDEIWVAKGIYVERITLKLNTALYGGFAGGETSRTQRNWTAKITILDGNKASGVVTAPSGATSSTRIDGFTIRNGKASYDGGGIFCSSSSPTIANNIITDNSASRSGGGICCYSSSPTIANNIITANSVINASSYGGGIYCSSSSPTISNNNITGNSANYGAGIYCNYNSSPAISNNNITGNNANGGYGGGIYCNSNSSPTISNNTIISNSTINGGGIYCSNSSPTISNNTITGNSVFGDGGGIYCTSSSPNISNNIVSFNLSGIYLDTSSGTPSLRNNCIYNPNAYNYSGLSAGVGDISVDPKLEAVQYGKVHIQPNSPCINAGYDTAVTSGLLDIDGQTRIQATHVDIGADESDGTTWSFTPAIIRVSPSGDDANDGSSWVLAKKTVQAGIDAASGECGEVWATAGTYNERIILKAFAHIYGGFTGTEIYRDQRDWRLNKSILDGGAAGRVVTVSITCGTNTIDGFTIRNGKVSSGVGGGIYSYYSSPTIANNTITGNSASSGGGICCYKGSPIISNNTIISNIGRGYGGGIESNYSSPTIFNNTITGNSCGGIICMFGSPIISSNIITGNRADRGSGGGINCSHSSPAISNNIITDNSALEGGGIRCTYSSSTISNNTIAGNSTSGSCGGIYCAYSSLTIFNNIVAFNSSGIYNDASSGTPSLRNNCVYNPSGYNYSGLSAGTNDIQLDPQFLAPWTKVYHLRPASPCINVGYDLDIQQGATDLDGKSRILGSHVDMGCFEWDTSPYWVRQVSQARGVPNECAIKLKNKIITASFDGAFYVEDSNRSSGLRILFSQNVTPGDLAEITGQMVLDNEERTLQATSVSSTAGNRSGIPTALYLNNRSVGGGNFFWNQNGEDCGQRGITRGSGLNNIGLLIKTSGAFTYVDASTFTIDDGSGVDIKCVVPDDVALNPGWTYVSVTGISSCEKDGVELHRLLRVRSQSDIMPY